MAIKRLRPHEVEGILEALYGPFRNTLTPWENNFVAGVQAQWDRAGSLSDKQHEKLAEIFVQRTSGQGVLPKAQPQVPGVE